MSENTEFVQKHLNKQAGNLVDFLSCAPASKRAAKLASDHADGGDEEEELEVDEDVELVESEGEATINKRPSAASKRPSAQTDDCGTSKRPAGGAKGGEVDNRRHRGKDQAFNKLKSSGKHPISIVSMFDKVTFYEYSIAKTIVHYLG